MRHFITKVAAFFITALLCTYVYSWTGLNTIFKVDITYIQWLAIQLILNLIIVGPLLNKPLNKKNESKGSKISLDIP
jgi:hypothetical protein